jgi:pimeloyl-ACP methyl ester carboxylesterase
LADPQTYNIEGHTLAALPINPGAAGEPVILVHGVTGNIAIWQVDPLPFVLEQGPCYALSLPGHYPAAFPPGFQQEQLTAEMLARIMAETIRRLVGERTVTLIGHSTGGFAVLNIAARFPGLARRVVSIAGFAHGRWTGFMGFYQRLVRMGNPGRAVFKSVYKLAGASPRIFKSVLRVYAADVYALYANPESAEALEESLYNFQHLDLDAMAQYYTVMPNIDITALLPCIQAPTLAIAGERDPTVPPDQSRGIASLVPNAELALIQGARHLSFLEHPVGYQTALSAWLKKTF